MCEDLESAGQDSDYLGMNLVSSMRRSGSINQEAVQPTASRRLKLSERGYKWCLRVELAGLCALIVMVWGLLAIPVFIFHLSEVILL